MKELRITSPVFENNGFELFHTTDEIFRNKKKPSTVSEIIKSRNYHPDYNLKNLNAVMDLLDEVRTIADAPSFPTREEIRDLNKARNIIDNLIDKL